MEPFRDLSHLMGFPKLRHLTQVVPVNAPDPTAAIRSCQVVSWGKSRIKESNLSYTVPNRVVYH